MGLTDEDIISKLVHYAKNKEIPVQVIEFIKMHSSSYGKAKIVLKNNQYFIEAVDKPTMTKLLSFEPVKQGIADFVVEERIAAEEATKFKYTEEGFEALMAEKQAKAGFETEKRQ